MLAFDDSKITKEKIIKLVMYDFYDNPRLRGFGKYFVSDEGWFKIPYEDVDRLTEKIRIHFLDDQGRNLAPSMLREMFTLHGNNYSIVPLEEKWVFHVTFQNRGIYSDKVGGKVLDATAFIENLNSYESGFSHYFDLVVTIIDDLRNHPYNVEYECHIDADMAIVIPVRNRHDFYEWIENREMDLYEEEKDKSKAEAIDPKSAD